MSSFNTVTKIKYTDNLSDLISLDEYIVFQDDKAKRKYIVFKFINNVTQQLSGMRFEVCQYNADGNLIEKSIIVYNEFLAGAEEEFVPKAKLRVSYNCSSISVRLIEAAYDRFVWKEGEYSDNCYKFDQFYKDENSGKEEEPEKKKKSREKKPKKVKYKKSKKPFAMKDATKKNLAKFPAVFNTILILLVLAFVAVSLFFFKKDAKKFTQGDYLVRIVEDSNVAIYGYTGDKTQLIIPAKLGKYNVTKIDEGAFKNSEITSVTINCDLLVEEGAFVNCKKLAIVYSERNLYLEEKAFQNCPSLRNVYLPNSFYPVSAFYNCGN